MKVITLIQPWATLIALGEKKIETRSWKTNYRGPLLIHAGKKVDSAVCLISPFDEVLAKSRYIKDLHTQEQCPKVRLPSGVIIAKCNLVDCVKVIDWRLDSSLRVISATLENNQIIKGNELEFGDYVPGRYAWILEDIEMLPKPISAKGKLNLWEYTRYIERRK